MEGAVASFIASDGQSFALAEGDNLLGREGRQEGDPPKLNLGPLREGASVSRRHAQVFLRGQRWYLRALSSTNPTLVGGRVVPPDGEVPLPDDAEVKLGNVVLIFRAPAPPNDKVDPSVTLPPVQPVVTPKVEPQPPPTPPQPPGPTLPPRTETWVANLPPRPDLLRTLGVGEFKRVNPFRGLMIDDAAWKDAHDYHRILAQLHLLAGHGWGIADGLEVIADEAGPDTIVVRPGVAIDFAGRAILVATERRLPIGANNPTTLYVSARLREEMAIPQRFWNDLDEYTRVIEKCEIQLTASRPAPPSLELARVTVNGPIRNAADPRDPKPGELDLRFRERLLVRPRPDVVVAQLLADGAHANPDASRDHQIGLRFLVQEIGLATGYRPRWSGTLQLGDPLPPASLLYLSGSRPFAFPATFADQLRPFLAGGGVLLADGCSENDPTEFATVIDGLARALGRSLQPVQRWHPLLVARHIFATPPLSVEKGPTLVEADGLVLTTADYGCAWAGGPRDRPLPRETIRAALELGVNLAVYARLRQRPLEALELG
jgi:hypothetical protein